MNLQETREFFNGIVAAGKVSYKMRSYHPYDMPEVTVKRRLDLWHKARVTSGGRYAVTDISNVTITDSGLEYLFYMAERFAQKALSTVYAQSQQGKIENYSDVSVSTESRLYQAKIDLYNSIKRFDMERNYLASRNIPFTKQVDERVEVGKVYAIKHKRTPLKHCAG